jgi:NAD(P)-dependent dehydrogenase (short-subunit alcohol dehydrogenase family)
MPKTAVVLGARNLGGAVLAHLLDRGWQGAAIARSDDSLTGVRERGALGLTADASEPDDLRAALARVRAELAAPDLIVNAVSAARPPRSGGSFGGGPLTEATLEDMRGWASAVSEQAFVFLSEGLRALTDGGTLVQVTGGSSRRALPGRGLWSAGAQATRALVQTAAQELREQHVHAALLIVDATISSPKTGEDDSDRTADQRLIAEAVEFLAEQEPRAWTHELVLTPAGDRWTP